jgi:2,5-diketo-D-gluconate reductase B
MDKFLNIKNDKIPVLGIGTYGMNGKECTKGIEDSIRIGYRHIDTAQSYNNEEEVGEGIKKSGVDRKEIFLTTKIATHNLNPEAIKRTTQASLEKLNSEYIDLLLIHWPTPGMNLTACLETMFGLREQGKIRHVGVSNFSPSLFKKSIDIGPVMCNQVEFTPYSPQFANLELAKAENVMITAYSPLLKGRIIKDKTLKEIGDRHDKTAAQITLRWLLQLGNISVIPKASSEKHRRENLDIFDFELNEEEMEIISELKRYD